MTCTRMGLLALTLAAITTGCGQPFKAPPQSVAMQRTVRYALTAWGAPLPRTLAAATLHGLGALPDDTMPAPGAPSFALKGVAAPDGPPTVDLRSSCPPVYDQGPFFSCTAFAVAKGLGEFLLRRRGDTTPLSAAHFYASTEWAPAMAQNHRNANTFDRDMPNFSGVNAVADTGMPLSCAIATLEMGGAVAEVHQAYPEPALWQGYADYRVATPRTANHNDDATHVLSRFFAASDYRFDPDGTTHYWNRPTKLRIRRGKPVAGLAAARRELARGMPVVAAFEVYEGFYGKDVAKTGRMALPTPTERYASPHAMLIVGYDDADRTLLVRNSWGAAWGDGGYGRVPYAAYDRGLIPDAWTVELE